MIKTIQFCYNKEVNILLLRKVNDIIKKIFVILCFFCLLFVANIQVFASDDEVERTIDEINSIRLEMNLPSLNSDGNLKKAAVSHSQYMSQNDIFSTLEDNSKSFYRGRYPWDRVKYYDYAKTYIFEFISQNANTYSEVVKQSLNNPYSRSAILDPLYTDIGMGSYLKYYTYLIGGEKRDENYSVSYPYDQQKNVSVSWENNYVLSPYDGRTGFAEKSGVPITFLYYSNNYKIESIDIEKVQVIDMSSNQTIEVQVLTPENDRNLKNGVIVLPINDYSPNTQYHILFEANYYFDTNKDQFYRYVYNGTFTTGDNLENEKSETFLKRGTFTKEIIKALNIVLESSFEIIFKDVDIKSVDAKYIYTAYYHNLVKGIGGNIFVPESNITREQAYTLLIRAYEYKKSKIILSEDERKLLFSDQDKISFYAVESIIKAKKIGLLIDLKSKKLNPTEYITEDEFMTILSIFKKLV